MNIFQDDFVTNGNLFLNGGKYKFVYGNGLSFEMHFWKKR